MQYFCLQEEEYLLLWVVEQPAVLSVHLFLGVLLNLLSVLVQVQTKVQLMLFVPQTRYYPPLSYDMAHFVLAFSEDLELSHLSCCMLQQRLFPPQSRAHALAHTTAC